MRLFDRAPQTLEIKIEGRSFVVDRGRLGLHLKLGEILDTYNGAVGARNLQVVFRALAAYWEEATQKKIRSLEEVGFCEAAKALMGLWELNRLRFFPPFLKEEITPQKVPWDYEGRSTAIWIHSLASHYQWSRQEIINLEPEEAVIYIQEIMIDDQFRREWEWGLSDRSLTYDKRSKKTRFNPLKRPTWMYEREPAVVKIPKASLPVGLVITNPEELNRAREGTTT